MTDGPRSSIPTAVVAAAAAGTSFGLVVGIVLGRITAPGPQYMIIAAPTAAAVERAIAQPTQTTGMVLQSPTATPTVAIRPASSAVPPTQAATAVPLQPNGSPLPAIKTATSVPLRPTTLTLTEAEATQRAQEALGPSLPLDHLTVSLRDGILQLQGDMAPVRVGVISGPSGQVRAVARPAVRDQDLQVQVSSMTLNGAEIADQATRRRLETAINDALLRWIGGRRVDSVGVQNGAMTVVVLEQS